MGPLISATELESRLDEPALRLADTRWYLGEPERGRVAYAASHLPGAVYVDLDEHLSAAVGPGRHPLPDPGEFAARIGRLGIAHDHDVVVYDDRGGAVAARLWWMLRSLGHERVAVLDGGLTAWRAAGLPETDAAPDHAPVEFVAPGHWTGIVDRSAVERQLGAVPLLDARSGDRYRGETEPIDPVAGHIPTAVNVPHEDNLGIDDRFRPPRELRRRLAAAGADGTGPFVAYCGSGVTACHDLLAAAVAGVGGGLLYPGSWSDWATTGGAVAVGPDPGTQS